MLVNFFQQSCSFEICNDLLARVKAVEAAIFCGRMFVDLCIQCEDGDDLQIVTLAHSIVVEVMRGRDLHAAGAEFLVHIVVGDDRDVALA